MLTSHGCFCKRNLTTKTWLPSSHLSLTYCHDSCMWVERKVSFFSWTQTNKLLKEKHVFVVSHLFIVPHQTPVLDILINPARVSSTMHGGRYKWLMAAFILHFYPERFTRDLRLICTHSRTPVDAVCYAGCWSDQEVQFGLRCVTKGHDRRSWGHNH